MAIPPEVQHGLHNTFGIDYKFLAENCADILCSIAPDQLIEYVSPSCSEIRGWKPAEMMARDLRQFIYSDDLPTLESMEFSKPPEGVAYTHARLRLLRKDQTFVWISVNARCVGVATATPEQEGALTAPHDLLKAADKALYQPKHDGHNRVEIAAIAPASDLETT